MNAENLLALQSPWAQILDDIYTNWGKKREFTVHLFPVITSTILDLEVCRTWTRSRCGLNEAWTALPVLWLFSLVWIPPIYSTHLQVCFPLCCCNILPTGKEKRRMVMVEQEGAAAKPCAIPVPRGRFCLSQLGTSLSSLCMQGQEAQAV